MSKLTIPLVILIASVLVGLALYTPLPDGVAEPNKLQVFLAGLKIMKALNMLLTYVGTHSYIENMQWLLENGLPHQFESAEFGDVKLTQTTMAGVPVVIYRPVTIDQDFAPATVFFHGGGFVLLSAATYDLSVYELARQSQTVVVSVDYRLAPVHPFPAGVYDCLNVTDHILRDGDKYGIDSNRVGVAGDSAGGNLAAVVSLHLGKSSSLPSLKFQVLIYPLLQAVDFHLPSYVNNNKATPSLLDRDYITYLMAMYFGLGDNAIYYGNIMAAECHIPENKRKEYSKFVHKSLLPSSGSREETIKNFDNYSAKSTTGADKSISHRCGLSTGVDMETYGLLAEKITSPLFCPLFAESVSHVPPAFVHVAEFDVLRDEGILYASKLKSAGVEVLLHYPKGGTHGEINRVGLEFMDFKIGGITLQNAGSFIRSKLIA